MACPDHYAGIAENYDKLYSFRDQFADEFVKDLVEICDLSNDQDLVDLACGTGWVQRILSNNGYNFKSSIAVDPSQSLLDCVKANVQGVTCMCLDGLQFSRQDLRYDRIIISQAFHHLPIESIEETLRNIRSQLRSGGKLIVTYGDGGYFSQDVARRLITTGEYSPVDFTASAKICDNAIRKSGFEFSANSPVKRAYKVRLTREQFAFMLRQRYVSSLHVISDEEIEEEVKNLPEVVEFEYKWLIFVASPAKDRTMSD